MGEYKIRDLFVEVTNLCWQECIHCSSCAGPEVFESIPIKSLYSLIEQTVPFGLETFTLSGGEPLLYPDIIPLISFIVAKKLKFNVYTCGVYRSNEGVMEPIPDDMLDQFVELGINRMIFSMQGASAFVHEKVSTLTGSFEITKRSITKALDRNINVELHFVPMTVNIDDVEDVVAFAAKNKIKKVSLLRLVPQGRCDENLMLSYVEKQKLNMKAEALNKLFPDVEIRMGAPFNCVTLAGNPCTAAQNKLLISANGDIFPCEAFKFLKGKRPKIYTSKIKDVWENDELLNKIRNLIEGSDICRSCSLNTMCRGGCHGQRLERSGSLKSGCDPDCRMEHYTN